MARFDRQIATAQRLIKKNGQLVTWRPIENGDPANPDKPWRPSLKASKDNSVYICFLPITREGAETFTFLSGSLVPDGSICGLMGAVDFEPNLKDVVIRNGVEFRMETLDILAPNGQAILYTMRFKG